MYTASAAGAAAQRWRIEEDTTVGSRPSSVIPHERPGGPELTDHKTSIGHTLNYAQPYIELWLRGT